MENYAIRQKITKKLNLKMMSEERYEFTKQAKKRLIIFLLVGVVLSVLGLFTTNRVDDHHTSSHHVETNQKERQNKKSVDGDSHTTIDLSNESQHNSHTSPIWLKRLLANLWINSVYFTGLSIIGVFFFALQYAAQAGWSAGIKRIPLAYGAWLPIAFITLLLVFLFGGHDIFHWTHKDLYHQGTAHFDKIINGKKGYFFWPLQEHPNVPVFWLGRLVLFFVIWYWIFKKLRSYAFQEDRIGGTETWYKMRKLSAIFLVFFAVSSSIAAWDWIMSIDTHWFSTMMGWYVFASWWVAGLALTLLLVIVLKEKKYLSFVNENHLHDLGKFVFAFSIFWMYIWFSQFLLIYYAHIPEETIYFVERWKNDHYAPVFFINLILNFFLPFLFLMTREAKRHTRMLKVVCCMVIFGHWLDFYLMVSPGTLGKNAGFGLLETGLILVYLSAFLYVVFNTLSKAPLFAKNHPMLKESLYHHV